MRVAYVRSIYTLRTTSSTQRVFPMICIGLYIHHWGRLGRMDESEALAPMDTVHAAAHLGIFARIEPVHYMCMSVCACNFPMMTFPF